MDPALIVQILINLLASLSFGFAGLAFRTMRRAQDARWAGLEHEVEEVATEVRGLRLDVKRIEVAFSAQQARHEEHGRSDERTFKRIDALLERMDSRVRHLEQRRSNASG